MINTILEIFMKETRKKAAFIWDFFVAGTVTTFYCVILEEKQLTQLRDNRECV